MPRRTSYRAGVPCWIDCLTGDPAAAEQYYRHLFGWDFDSSDGYRLIRLDGEIIGGLGVVAGSDAGHGAFWTTYLASKDLRATMAAIRTLGGRIVMPPTAAGDDGVLCLALDTSGAAVGFFCGAHADGVVLIDEPGAVVRHQLRTPDLTAASAFYGGLVDGTITPGPDGAVLLIDGRKQADLVRLPAGQPAEMPRWIPVFGVADLAAATARAADGGGRVLPNGPAAPADDVLISDPTGAVFGLTEIDRAA